MKCWKPEKECRFRDEKGYCRWECEQDTPPSDCEIANENWGCPFNCYYEAKEHGCEDVDKYSFDWRDIR